MQMIFRWNILGLVTFIFKIDNNEIIKKNVKPVPVLNVTSNLYILVNVHRT